MSELHDASMTDFVALLTDHQPRLWAFVLAAVGDAELARDVLQETNLVLWRKAGEYERGRPFAPWALAIARYQVMAARERRSRDWLVFDDQQLQLIAAEFADDQAIARQQVLAECMSKLPAAARALLDRRYGERKSVTQVAREMNRSTRGLAVTLHRIRRALAECMDRALSGGMPR